MRLPMTASKRRNQVGSSAFECGGRYRPPLCLRALSGVPTFSHTQLKNIWILHPHYSVCTALTDWKFRLGCLRYHIDHVR
jgi:hypothetical protein